MRPTQIIAHSAVLVFAIIANATSPMAQGQQLPSETDPAEQLADNLWTPDRLASVIAVRAQVMTEKGFARVYGTAFLISEEYALTAGHVVCNSDGSPSRQVELLIGGAGAQAIAPISTICSVSNADAALIRVPTLNSGRKHLEPGIPEAVATDHFVTAYGYGTNLAGGRFLKGNARLPEDILNRIRTDIGASPGDSGAPVVNQSGKVVGILIAGDSVGTTAYVSLRKISQPLSERSIFVPPPTAPAISQTDANARLAGIVLVQLGRLADGSWPSPRTRAASDGEITVLAIVGASGQPFSTSTSADGKWSVPVPVNLPAAGTEFSVMVANATEADKPIEERSYWSDPRFGFATAADLAQPQTLTLTLYARSSYVAYELSVANAEASTIPASQNWSECWPSAAIESQAAPGCTADVRANIQRRIRLTDESFRHAFVASSTSPDDIEITTKIAATWANFRLTTNNACRATQVMRSLFEQFTNNTLSGSLIAQTVSMIVACQAMPENAAGVMVWRTGGETRQEASVRMIEQTLVRFARSPAQLHAQRATVIGDVSTALESYQPGAIRVADAAKIVANDDLLSRFLTTFMTKYATALCRSKPIQVNDVASATRALNQLRALISTCS